MDYGTVIAALKSEMTQMNIETLLSRIRSLASVIGGTKVHGLDGAGYEKLSSAICSEIGKIVDRRLPDGTSPYTDIVSWISGTGREHPIEVFTTNYDLLFEEAMERAGIPFFDGFSGAHEPFFDPSSVAANDLPPRWTRIWKPHGSLAPCTFLRRLLLLGIVGNGTAYLGYSRAIASWFVRRRGMAFALMLAGGGCGAMLLPIFTQSLISNYSRYFGLRRFSTLYAFAWTAFAILGAVGPIIVGRVFDTFGSYRPLSIQLLAIPALIPCLLMFFLPRYQEIVLSGQTSIDALPGISAVDPAI